MIKNGTINNNTDNDNNIDANDNMNKENNAMSNKDTENKDIENKDIDTEVSESEDTNSLSDSVDDLGDDTSYLTDVMPDCDGTEPVIKNTMKGRIVMYTQLLATIMNNLGISTIKELEAYIRKNICMHAGDEFAIILHDKDISSLDATQLAKAHIHIAFKFVNVRSLMALIKKLNDYRADGSPNLQTLTLFKGNPNNMYSYLVHRTRRAADKYQYDPSDVLANFDFAKRLQIITQQVINAEAGSNDNLDLILEGLKERTLTVEDVEEMLPARVYARNISAINTVAGLANRLEARAWRARREANKEFTRVIWIWGAAGTGKSSFAKEMAYSLDANYYLAIAEEGMWDEYQAYQHVALIDECRPSMFKSYREVLTTFDNHQSRNSIHARYYNRELALDTIIITSVYSPFEFYNLIQPSNQLVDEFHQLERRISRCIHTEPDFIFMSQYYSVNRRYINDTRYFIKNLFSEAARAENGTSIEIGFIDTVFLSESVYEHYNSYEDDLYEGDALCIADVADLADFEDEYADDDIYYPGDISMEDVIEIACKWIDNMEESDEPSEDEDDGTDE